MKENQENKMEYKTRKEFQDSLNVNNRLLAVITSRRVISIEWKGQKTYLMDIKKKERSVK